MPSQRPSSVRLVPDNATVLQNLGLLAGLAGTWHGTGFNLIARPDKQGGGDLFLELNQTTEMLVITPIGSDIPNRGFAQDDIDLFGLTYLQQISDAQTGGALHIEPGVWVTSPNTVDPSQTAPEGGQIVFRQGAIPHGSSFVAQGSAIPVIPSGGTFNFTAVNTAPFQAGTTMPPGDTMGGFPPYDLDNTTPAAVNFRSSTIPGALDGVLLEHIIQDPTRLLQERIAGQNITEMVVIDIATIASVDSQQVPNGAGGISNIPFLGPNADASEFFATFWIETIEAASGPITQLQYVQTVLLNFPVLSDPKFDFSWPHVSVATLQKTFG